MYGKPSYEWMQINLNVVGYTTNGFCLSLHAVDRIAAECYWTVFSCAVADLFQNTMTNISLYTFGIMYGHK